MMEKQIMELNKRYARKKMLKRIVALLCVFVMLFTVNSLKMVAQTLTRKPMCGLKEHQHKAKCYDASGNLVCGKVEHQHTDACYQESPTLEIEDDSAIGVNNDLALDEGGLSLDLDAGALDLNDDLVTEDVAAPVANEAPVTPTYVLGSKALLSNIIESTGLNIKIKKIKEVGIVDNDGSQVGLVEITKKDNGDYRIKALRDFDQVELAIVLADEVVVVKLLDGVAPAEPVVEEPAAPQVEEAQPAPAVEVEQPEQPAPADESEQPELTVPETEDEQIELAEQPEPAVTEEQADLNVEDAQVEQEEVPAAEEMQIEAPVVEDAQVETPVVEAVEPEQPEAPAVVEEVEPEQPEAPAQEEVAEPTEAPAEEEAAEPEPTEAPVVEEPAEPEQIETPVAEEEPTEVATTEEEPTEVPAVEEPVETSVDEEAVPQQTEASALAGEIEAPVVEEAAAPELADADLTVDVPADEAVATEPTEPEQTVSVEEPEVQIEETATEETAAEEIATEETATEEKAAEEIASIEEEAVEPAPAEEQAEQGDAAEEPAPAEEQAEQDATEEPAPAEEQAEQGAAAEEPAPAEEQAEQGDAAEEPAPADAQAPQEDATEEPAPAEEQAEQGDATEDEAAEPALADAQTPQEDGEEAAEIEGEEAAQEEIDQLPVAVDAETADGEAGEPEQDEAAVYTAGSREIPVNDAVVTLTWPAEAKIPEDVVITIEEIEKGTEDYDLLYHQALAELPEPDQAVTQVMRFFDITLYTADGQKIEPKAPVSVVVSVNETIDSEVSALHCKEVGAPMETVDANAEGESVAFDAPSFSVYGVNYQVPAEQTSVNSEVSVDLSRVDTMAAAKVDGMSVSLSVADLLAGTDDAVESTVDSTVDAEQFVAEATVSSADVTVQDGTITLPAEALDKATVSLQLETKETGKDYITTVTTHTVDIVLSDYAGRTGETVGEGVTVKAVGENSLPADAKASVEENVAVPESVEVGENESATAFDINLTNANGDAITGPVAVTVMPSDLNVLADVPEGAVAKNVVYTLVHVHDDGTMENVELPADAVVVDENGKVESFSFETESFSTYVLKYTVDFHFAGGDFSIVGGSGVYFSVIANELNLYGKVEGFAMEKIDDMAFSNPQLVSVERVVDDSGAANWLLRSLQPFNSEETLTLHMIDNSVMVIDVTDDQTGLASFITDARIVIDGTTYGPGETWPVYEDVDYDLTLSFSERGSRQFPKGGESISMDLPSGMTIPEGTNGTFTIEAGLAGNVTGNSYRVEGGKLIITFGNDPSDILTRSSNVHFDLNFVCQITENAQKIKFTDGVEGNIELKDGADVTVNKTGSYNETTGQMDYTVTLSSKGNSSNVQVHDVISGDKLTLDQNSIVINPSKELVGGITKSNNGFHLTIKELANGETVTIKYSANIDMSGIGSDFKIIDAATNGKNTVNVENDDTHTDSSEFIYDNVIKYSNIRKVNSTVEDATEEGKKILTWKIVANDNYRGSIVGGSITDKIDWNSAAAMKYVTNADGKVALSIVAKNPDGSQTYSWTDTVTIDVNGDQQSWTYTIPQKVSANEILSYEITYQTVVDPSLLPAYNNGTVKNDTTNDHGGSTSGTGFVGGGGDEPGDETTITATKTAKTVTSEYIDWDIVVVIPAEGYDTFEIVDDLPLTNGQPNGADMPYGDPIVSGLVEGVESYKTEIIELVGQDAQWIKRDGENLTAYRMKLTFYKDQAKTQTGLTGTGNQRLLTVTIRTKNDPVWLEQGNGQTHTNNAKINGYQVSASAKPVRSTVTKKVSSATAIDGMPAYFYQIVLTNVTSDTVELDDFFDGNHLTFGDSKLLVDGGGTPDTNSQYILYWGENDYDQNHDMGSNTYNLPLFTTPEAGHLHIKVENIPKTAQGAYYPYYIVRYVLKVKDQDALNDIKEKAIRNKGKFEIANSAFWDTTGDDVTIDYEVTGLDKDGWFRNSIYGVQNPNERVYDFVIDVNPQSLQLNGGEEMEISDTHTDNLSVQYQSVMAFRVTGDVTKDTFKSAVQEYLKNHEDATGFTMDGITPASEVSWNFSGNIGTFSGIEDRTHYLIYYSSLITGSNQQNFSNEAEMEGFIDTQSSTRTYGSSGSGAATVYQIGLLKYKDGKTSEGLQGVKFQLFRGDNKEPMTYGDTEYTRAHNLVGKNITFTTGADGYVRVALNQTDHGAELEEDVQYWLKEIESPAGYQIDSSVEYWKFKLTTDPDEVNYGKNGEYIYFYYDDIMKMSNTPTNEPLTVKVDKLWLGLDGENMRDAEKESLTATVQLYKKTNAGEYEAVTGKISNQGGTQKFDGTVVLNKTNNWTYTWSNLPRVDSQGNKYAYKLEEIAGPETTDIYASSVALSEDETNKNYVITNQKVEQRNVDVSVSKTWLDREGNALAVEDLPEYIRFYLYRVVSKVPFKVAPTSGGNPYDAGSTYNSYLVPAPDGNTGLYQLTKSNSNNYTSGLTFANLPSIVVDQTNNDATFYAYYVKEVPVDGYAPSAVVTTTTDTTKYKTTVALTNQKLPEPIDLTVTKAWKDDAGETMSSKPSDITFHLYQVASTTPFSADPKTWPTSGGSLYTVAEKTSTKGTYYLHNYDNPYEVSFDDLPANSVDAKGKVTYYAYYVDEVEVDGYDASYATALDPDTGAYTITMTNQQTPKYTSITADKTWLDKDGGPNLLAEKTDADAVTLDVYRVNGTSLPVGSVIVNGQEQEISSLKTITIVSRGGAILATDKVIARDGDKVRVTLTLNDDDVNKWNDIYIGYGTDQNANTVKLVEDKDGANLTYTQDITVNSNVVYIMAGPGWINNVTSSVTVENNSISSLQYKLTQAQAEGISSKEYVDTLTLNKSNGWTATLSNLLAESQGTKYTYFVVERGGSEYQAEYVYDGTTVHVTNREKDMLEVDKKWLNAAGEDYTVAKQDGEISFSLKQIIRKIPTVKITVGDVKYGISGWGESLKDATVTGDLTDIKKGSNVTISLSYSENSNHNSLEGLSVTGAALIDNRDFCVGSPSTRSYMVRNIQSDLTITGLFSGTSSTNGVLTIDIRVSEGSGATTEGSDVGTEIEIGTFTVGYDSINSTTMSSPYTVAAGKTPWSALIGNLPTTDGTNNFKYYVEETEVTGFDKSGDGAANVVEAGGKITVTNQKQPTGSLRVEKELAGLTYNDLTDEQKQALSKISFTVTNSSGETVATISLGHALEGKTIGDLAPGTYTVTETRPNDSSPSGYLHKKTTVKVNEGTVTETLTATATVSANTVTNVTYVNEYGPATADLTVTKRIDKANSATEDVTFYVGLFANATATTPIAAGEVGGTNPQPITFTANSADTSNTATFTGLTVGTTYYVFETDSTGRKVTTADKTSGYAITTADVGGKPVEIAVSSNTATIHNTYSATGSVGFEAKKVFTNGNLGEHPFTFKLTQVTGNNQTTPATSNDVGTGEGKIPALKLNAAQTKNTTATTDTVTFGAINFTKNTTVDETGEYWFLLEEQLPDGVTAENPIEDGIKYDTHKKWIKVTVTDAGDGTLTVTKDPDVTNGVDGTWTNEQLGSIKLKKVALYNGQNMDEVNDCSFPVVLQDSKDDTVREGDIVTGHWEDQTWVAPDWVVFDNLPYGTYYLYEKNQDEGNTLATNGTVQRGPYTFTVTMTDKTGTTPFTNPITIDDSHKNVEIVVKNTIEEKGSLTVTKKVFLNSTEQTAAQTNNETFYVALFRKADGSEVYTGRQTTLKANESYTFDQLETRTTYVVYEMTAAIESGDTAEQINAKKLASNAKLGEYTVTYNGQEQTLGIVNDRDKSATVTNTKTTTDFIVQKRWMWSNDKWNADYGAGENDVKTIYFKLKRTVDGVVTYFNADGNQAAAGDQPVISITYGESSNKTAWVTETDAGVTVNEGQTTLHWVKQFTNLPGNRNQYEAIECNKDGEDYTEDENYHIGSVLNSTAQALKNDLVEVQDTKTWKIDNQAAGSEFDNYYIKLQLQKDGKDFLTPQVVGKDKNWSYKWQNLAKYNPETGSAFVYAVKEVGVYASAEDAKQNKNNLKNMFVVTEGTTTPNGSLYTTPIENHLHKATITIAKVKKGTTTPLADAKFQLTRLLPGETVPSKFENDAFAEESGKKTGPVEIKDATTGAVQLSGLLPGTYIVSEVKAPAGYIITVSPFTFTINADGTVSYYKTGNDGNGLVTYKAASGTTPAEFQVENEPGVALPATGGPGTTLFYVAGSALLLLALALLLRKKQNYD